MLIRAILGAVITAVGCAGAVVFAYAVILVGVKGQRASERAWGRAAKLPRAVFAGYFGAAGLALLSTAHLALFYRDEEWFWLIAPQQGAVVLSLAAGWLAMHRMGRSAHQ
ncbi:MULTISPECIES: hypothetical protein [Micromonospora]|uniref:hypothetical protein n=1 Tax=Micromonospora TaxID=1873 RepID=UPI00115113E6|nr:hypothetical protein [Micromonospora sp. A202]TQJ25975.1 hypothetical protein FBZ33_6354 [Micromonospora sp. A202]